MQKILVLNSFKPLVKAGGRKHITYIDLLVDACKRNLACVPIPINYPEMVTWCEELGVVEHVPYNDLRLILSYVPLLLNTVLRAGLCMSELYTLEVSSTKITLVSKVDKYVIGQ